VNPCAATPTPLSGKTFVLTGTLPTLDREEAKDLIEAAGGKVAGSASARKPALWWPAKRPAASWTRAHELGVPVLDEAGLQALLEGLDP
jgi:DNA ligase (NAD+)